MRSRSLLLKDQALSYEIELIDEEHALAYRKFLRGNEKPLKALLEEGSKHIEAIELASSTKFASELAYGVANPFLPIISWRTSGRRAHSHEHGETSWGTIRDKYAAEYVWKRKYNFLHLDFRRQNKFLAGLQKSLENDWDNGGKKEVTSYFFALDYKFDADHGRERRLKSQLKKFKKTTGLNQYCFQVPDIEKKIQALLIQEFSLFF